MDFDQTCTSILLKHWKNWLGFGDLDLIFMATLCLLKVGWFWPNLHSYIVWTCRRTNYILVTLTPFSRSHKGLEHWKMACLHPISWRNVWILTKLAQVYCCDMEKNWFDFGDLDPIFKVTGGLRLLINGLSASYLLNEWMDFDQTCTAILLTQVQELIRFWWHWPHFQAGHRRA